jgi:PPM family protein phosphatase
MNVTKARVRQSPQPENTASDRSIFVREAAFASGWMRLDTAVASSRGRLHAINEDWYSALDGARPLFVVADGVGSGAMASHASRELVSRLHQTLELGRIDADAIRCAILTADREIGRSIASRTDASGAATVALCAASGVSRSRWLIAWVGDCRAYRVSALRGAAAQLLTQDDTYRHLNQQPPSGGSLDDPARMVGNGAVDAPNVRDVDLGRDEMLLLCSDGIHKHATPGDIARLLRGEMPLATRCVHLIELARASGSNDDATVLVVQRAERTRARLARLISFSGLIALVAGALLWFATDWVTAQRLPPASALLAVRMQP